VMHRAFGTTWTLRDIAARAYQDLTGTELFVIARRA
jgi:hypothetical protein